LQAWVLSSNHTIRPVAYQNLCLDIRGGGGLDNIIQTFSCNGGSNQAWHFNGAVMNDYDDQCLQLPLVNGVPLTASGTPVTMGGCNYYSYQVWNYVW
jgi:Ricin-type beta-trefoil lectin domain